MPARATLLPPLWLRLSSLGALLTSLAFFSLSVRINTNHRGNAKALLSSLLVAMALCVFLTVCSLWYLRMQHQGTEQAFRDTDCEFSSIFQNVLDGILIINNEGNCIDANPAAEAILRFSGNRLIGQNIGNFLAHSEQIAEGWKVFLANENQRGRARLIAGDGTLLMVDFTVGANYLPGRHVVVLCDVTERAQAESSLTESEERFQLMANNIQEIFWMMDAETQEVTYVNRAYLALTGYTIEHLHTNPSSYRELIHPEDRIRVLSKLCEVLASGTFDEEFRFIRADGVIRWVWARGFPVRADGLTRWLVGTAHDITSRKQAELQISEHLDAAEAARAEADALRKSTLALSQNLAMDSVLDTLLRCISELVPFDKASVLFVENESELMVAREASKNLRKRIGLTLSASEDCFLQRVLLEKKATLLPNVAAEPQWRDTEPLDQVQSWLGIPLVAADRVLGILSLGANSPFVFTSEHLRLAKSLAVPAAVAIQNARVHERAEIYAAELQVRLQELQEAQNALELAETKPS